jgi:hypothetical protein
MRQVDYEFLERQSAAVKKVTLDEYDLGDVTDRLQYMYGEFCLYAAVSTVDSPPDKGGASDAGRLFHYNWWCCMVGLPVWFFRDK